MTGLTFELSELEIIGYADSLSESFVPQIVPPIFRRRTEPDRIVMPPFRIEGSRVDKAKAGFDSDLERAVMRGQATRFDVIIAARPGYRLWIDETFEPHYEPAMVVSETLRRLAQSNAREAQHALAEGRLEEAMRLAQTAISADDGCLNAILVKALVHQLEGDHACVEILTDIAETIVPGADFQAWVEFFHRLVMEQARRETRSIVHWPGAGGWVDVEDPYSDKEIEEALISRYKNLSEMELDLEAESESFVM